MAVSDQAERNPYAETEKELIALAGIWQSRLGLEHWKIKHVFLQTRDRENDSTGAETDALWQYNSATIQWYLTEILSYTPHELEDLVVHELAHVLNAPVEAAMKDDKEDQAELATELIARALLAGWGSAL